MKKLISLAAALLMAGAGLFAGSLYDDIKDNDLPALRRKVELLELPLDKEPYLAFYLKNASSFDPAMFDYLLEKGADPNLADAEGARPLHWAIWKFGAPEVKALLDKGADFSTGPFQMKPSFAEALEAEFQKPGALPEGLQRRFAYAAGLDGPELHLARLERLDSLAWEAAYLCGFVKLLEGRFRLVPLPPVERLRFLAAAYNAGFARSRESILASEDWAFFPPPESDFLAPRLRYADIALAFLSEGLR
jgi:hypothetical protein